MYDITESVFVNPQCGKYILQNRKQIRISIILKTEIKLVIETLPHNEEGCPAYGTQPIPYLLMMWSHQEPWH